MWVTPDDIAAEQFTHRRIRGGYDEAEVDDFLDLLACHVGEMQDYIDRLEAELDELRGAAAAQAAPGQDGRAAAPRPVQGVHVPDPAVRWELPVRPPTDGPVPGAHEAGPVGPYPELAPDRLDVVNGGRPHDVPRSACAPEATAFLSPTGEASVDRETTPGPGHPCCIRCERINPAEPCQGCYCHDDYPKPDPITSWQVPAFVPARSLADEIAEDAEEYLRSEDAAKAAREDPDPRVWRTFQDARRAAWCQRVGLDLDPIEWTAA